MHEPLRPDAPRGKPMTLVPDHQRQPSTHPDDQPTTIRVQAVPCCPVCSGTGEVAYQALMDRLCGVPGAWRLQRCRQDGALWLHPRPIETDLDQCYPDGYFTHNAPQVAVTDERSVTRERLRRSLLSAYYGYRHLVEGDGLPTAIAWALAQIPSLRAWAAHQMGASMLPYRRAGTLLDVGCGSGGYLARMRDYGWEVAGIEPDAGAAALGAREYGLTIHPGTMADAPFPPGSFDAVTSRHVLEHVPAPREFIQNLTRFLKPGGRLVIVTPNAGSLGHRFFGCDFYALDPPRHLVLFTVQAIRRLFAGVPELRLLSVGTPTHIARKVYKQGRAVRRLGNFQPAGFWSPRGDRWGAAFFSTAESAATVIAPLGEEIELVAEKKE
jgi:2-polyprenyl-3-methyl-5-hydroxy-6-metoxy-1,4-benzoquinol methylase